MIVNLFAFIFNFCVAKKTTTTKKHAAGGGGAGRVSEWVLVSGRFLQISDT